VRVHVLWARVRFAPQASLSLSFSSPPFLTQSVSQSLSAERRVVMATVGGLTQRKRAARPADGEVGGGGGGASGGAGPGGSGASGAAGAGGAAAAAAAGADEDAPEADLFADDDDDSDKRVKLTLLEEVVLLGLKDKQVRSPCPLDCACVRLSACHCMCMLSVVVYTF
jgi:hypothetical protein